MEQVPSKAADAAQVRWYHRKWFVVLMLIVFFPVGLVLLWTSPETKLTGRIAWSVVWALVVLARLGGGEEAPAPPPATPAVAQQPPQTPIAPAPATTGVDPEPTPEPAPEPAPEPSPAPAPAPPAKPEPTWQATHEWQGSGRKATETFQVQNREWRISWEATNEQIAGILQVYVFEESGSLLDLPVNHLGVGSDTTYVRGRAGGRYYLDINAANIDWVVRVEELR